MDDWDRQEYVHTDFGTLSSERVLALEKQVGDELILSRDLKVSALEKLVFIQDNELWREHINPQTEEHQFTNFWYGYLPWFLENYGKGYNLQLGVETYRARIRMYSKLRAQGWDTEGLMQKVIDLPLTQQRAVEQVVDMDSMTLKGVPDSHQAAVEYVTEALEQSLAPQSIMDLARGPSIWFAYDDSYISAVFDRDSGVDEYVFGNFPVNLPAQVRAAIITKLGAKPKKENNQDVYQ